MMENPCGWASLSVQYMLEHMLALSLITLYLIFILASCFMPATGNDSFPIVNDGGRRLFFPGIRQRWHWFRNGPRIIHDAYHKYSDAIYKLPALDRPLIVLPARYLSEIRGLPATIASVSHSTSDFFVGQWTTFDYEVFGHANIEAIRLQYITKLRQQVSPAANEMDYALNQHFPAYPGWTSVAIYPKILQTIGQTVARTVVGPELCRNPQWNEAALGYAQNVFMAAVCMKILPDFMRPLIAVFTPYVYRIHRCRRIITKLVSPTLRRRLDWKLFQPEVWKARLKSEEMTSLDWLVEISPEEESTIEMLAHRLTGVSFGATHTTASHITNCILDLAADFERWAPPLREEIRSVLGPDLTSFTNAELSRLRKMDSFMKEVQRFYAPSKLSVNRKLMESYTLSSGETLPKGSHISFSGIPMSQSEEYFSDAQTFDGFRFERMRNDPTKEHNGLQFTSSYAGSLHFGHGRQMCPGRFMGSMLSKLLIIKLLQRYDFKLRDGETRPKNLAFMEMDVPDRAYEILVRDRKHEVAG